MKKQLLVKRISLKFTCDRCERSFIKKLKGIYHYKEQPYCNYCGNAMYCEIVK